jgi:hypothetical protein
MNYFLIFSAIAFISVLIALIFVISDIYSRCKENKEFIQHLIVKCGEIDRLETHCDWLERRVKCHRLELDRLEREKGTDDETNK